jgi:mannose-6-phosphate isomerase
VQPLYPLRFEPIFRRYIWGGRRLATELNKPIGPEDDYAESWEVVDHGEDQSTVAAGPLAGATLGELLHQRGEELLGRHHPQEQFPLLLKFLDARRTLSVQVHPNDEQAAKLDPPDCGKTECWIVLAAEPGSLIYAGLKPGVDRPTLERAIREGTCEEQLHRFEPRPGECAFIPAGTIHALGEGLLVAELQQSSDTTYRLFDWNRVGADGQPRPLHIEQGLAVTDFDRGPVDPQPAQPTDRPGVERMVDCDKFILDRWTIDAPTSIGGDERCHILAVLDGSVRVAGAPTTEPLARGGTMLLPASVGPVELEPIETAVLIDGYLP